MWRVENCQRCCEIDNNVALAWRFISFLPFAYHRVTIQCNPYIFKGRLNLWQNVLCFIILVFVFNQDAYYIDIFPGLICTGYTM